jgi:thioredoxin 1
MADNIMEVTDDSFEKEVVGSDSLTVVDFWAEWCAPCKMIAPIIEELATEYSGKIKFGKLNVDDNKRTAMKYNIRGIPTLLVFKGGNLVDQIIGVKGKEELKKTFEKSL